MDISFVYSNQLKFWIARHGAFWGVMFAYQWLVDFLVPAFFEGPSYAAAHKSLLYSLVYLPGQFLLVYGLLYIVIPYFILKSSYVYGALLLALFCLLAGFANETFYRLAVSYSILPLSDTHSLGMHRILGVAGFAGCIKFMKYWYEKKYLNSVLEKEKLVIELQSLKAQVHPHFLFNTLNNIYSVTEKTSPVASEMLLRLSALLRYILYECNKPEILLQQEFETIKAYIALEGVRLNTNVDIQMNFAQATGNYLVSPLLLLPLIENCFKHGVSKMIDQPWINIQAELKGDVLLVKLMNSKPDHATNDSVPHGIGLTNVKKRLQLLYPEKHELKIHSEPDVFVVALKVELHRVSS
ncbi:sensor histidine kinase [Chryseolinea lacunae]|uniref:Histidine kinase n=1 Tax=Chryseolinea lacunae TaxID=2801331 RepID=A0ABS1KMP5_9BACT|nr:histidine kinase [Chryseolinea lacunae]MBL0740603.1 histidine kinase [Chryseolinea lacunae]